MNIRMQTNEDRPAIEALLRYLFEDIDHLPNTKVVLAQVMKYRVPGSDFTAGFDRLGFVAEENGVVIGYLLAEHVYPVYAVMAYLVIEPKYQNIGVGSQLFSHSMTVLRGRGTLYIDILTHSDARRTISFYEKRGFRVIATHMRCTL